MKLTPEERAAQCSFATITEGDLRRLYRVWLARVTKYYDDHPSRRSLFEENYLGAALCQGAALHYLDGVTGIRDLRCIRFLPPSGRRAVPLSHARLETGLWRSEVRQDCSAPRCERSLGAEDRGLHWSGCRCVGPVDSRCGWRGCRRCDCSVDQLRPLGIDCLVSQTKGRNYDPP